MAARLNGPQRLNGHAEDLGLAQTLVSNENAAQLSG